MAGDWIKMEVATPEKPEVFALTTKMGWVDPDLTVGKLFRFWRWFDQQTVDGNAKDVTPALLDRIAGATGFTKALIEVGWLEITPTGVRLPNFARHNGVTAKNRAETARRVAKHRVKASDGNIKSVTAHITESLPEKRREEKSKEWVIRARDSENHTPLLKMEDQTQSSQIENLGAKDGRSSDVRVDSGDRGIVGARSDGGDSVGDGTPEGLNQLEYARMLLEELGWPALRMNLVLVSEAIVAESKASGMTKASAYEKLRTRVLEDKDEGIPINGFYFQEAKWRKVKDAKPKHEVLSPAEIRRRQLEED